MVNQKPISLKLDYQALEALDSEVFTQGRKRNRIINDAVLLYCRLLDADRTASYVSDDYTLRLMEKLFGPDMRNLSHVCLRKSSTADCGQTKSKSK